MAESTGGARNWPSAGPFLLLGAANHEIKPREVKENAQRPSDRDRGVGDRGAASGAGNGS